MRTYNRGEQGYRDKDIVRERLCGGKRDLLQWSSVHYCWMERDHTPSASYTIPEFRRCRNVTLGDAINSNK